ncbi:unnamed protein product [Didymodactylos carnosus]|uniref:Uncharacterized protein n=1 Tax=Didymodactylos carnosus TaxID=1234261 RepID=A0A8S2FJW4_9BILA|nr:unnamed protein product [Didymodactylos carnosus]CAF4278794.1 unnamed protein product [Didymodactylos carnosus]
MINPNKIIVAQLTGFYELGMGTLVFDWNLITQVVGSPILVPHWALINMLVGFLVFIWFLTPIIYYSNLWSFKNLSIAVFPKLNNNGFYLFYTSDGNSFTPNVSQNALSSTYTENLPPVSLDSTTAIANYLTFASLASLIVYTILYNGKNIVQCFRTSLKSRENNIHCTLMSKYNEASEWWYILLFVITFILSALVCHFGQFMPWYYLFVAVPFTFVCLLPISIIQATTLSIFCLFLSQE